jgi:hypothetical protein
MKQIFSEPSHRPQASILIGGGLLLVIASFFFRGANALTSQITLAAAGMAEMLMGSAEFFPRRSRRAVGIARISAYGCLVLSILALIFLATGISL